jgi:hypothetical protein
MEKCTEKIRRELLAILRQPPSHEKHSIKTDDYALFLVKRKLLICLYSGLFIPNTDFT